MKTDETLMINPTGKKRQSKETIIPIESVKLETVYLALTLDTRKEGKESDMELLPVAVRINSIGRTIYHRTGYKCTRLEWVKLSKATGQGTKKIASLYNDKVNQISIFNKVKDATKVLLDKDDFTLENIKAVLTGRSENNFSNVWLGVIENRMIENKVGTANSYNNAYQSFTKCIGNNVEFSRIGVELMENWQDKAEVSSTTAGIYMRACRVAVNEAIKKGYIKASQYPFGKKVDGKVSIPKGRSRQAQYIGIPTIKKLMKFKAPEKWSKATADSKLEAVNYWMFSYLGNGLNLADMGELTYNKHYFESGETELHFIRKKTVNTTDEEIEIIIPIIPELKSILTRYGAKPKLNAVIFPKILNGEKREIEIKKIIRQQNSNIAERLKVVCKAMGLPYEISMTYARHSFATNLTHAGVSEKYISDAMGHMVQTITGRYIDLFPKEKRMTFNKMLLE